jgi:hypothetical protein
VITFLETWYLEETREKWAFLRAFLKEIIYCDNFRKQPKDSVGRFVLVETLKDQTSLPSRKLVRTHDLVRFGADTRPALLSNCHFLTMVLSVFLPVVATFSFRSSSWY